MDAIILLFFHDAIYILDNGIDMLALGAQS